MLGGTSISRYLLAGLAILLSGCDTTASCLGFSYVVIPEDTIVSLGSTFTPQVEIRGCAPEGFPRAGQFRWSTEGAGVLEVGHESGEIRTIGVGIATVVGVVPNEPHSVEVHVTVEP